jgi:hypothetical protein
MQEGRLWAPARKTQLYLDEMAGFLWHELMPKQQGLASISRAFASKGWSNRAEAREGIVDFANRLPLGHTDFVSRPVSEYTLFWFGKDCKVSFPKNRPIENKNDELT